MPTPDPPCREVRYRWERWPGRGAVGHAGKEDRRKAVWAGEGSHGGNLFRERKRDELVESHAFGLGRLACFGQQRGRYAQSEIASSHRFTPWLFITRLPLLVGGALPGAQENRMIDVAKHWPHDTTPGMKPSTGGTKGRPNG